jgi:hypothetical protein
VNDSREFCGHPACGVCMERRADVWIQQEQSQSAPVQNEALAEGHGAEFADNWVNVEAVHFRQDGARRMARGEAGLIGADEEPTHFSAVELMRG